MGSKLEEALKRINKEAGAEIVKIGAGQVEGVERIPFSSPRLNWMTYGGLPKGRIIEFFGPEGGGKTTTALDIIASVQAEGGTACFIDVENTFDDAWATTNGVNPNEIVYLRPEEDTAEQIFNYARDLIETGELALVVLDSVATMTSKQVYDEDFEKSSYSGIAKVLTRFLNVMTGKFRKYNCTFIIINQIRDKINSTYGGTDTTGGHGLKHAASVRMEFRKGEYLDEGYNTKGMNYESPIGNIVEVSLRKSKTFKNNRRKASYTLHYNDGILWLKDLIDVGIEGNAILKSGSWYNIIDIDTGVVLADAEGKPIKVQGQNKLFEILVENEQARELVQKAADKLIAGDTAQ